ncbi:MAG: diguanylate cyclase [Deltaproteobacteria bacterium]|nr:diguanylate cyclase [Deltaproteobacteria bacterium]
MGREHALLVETDLARASVVRHALSGTGLSLVIVREVGGALEHLRANGPPRLMVASLSVAGGDCLDVLEAHAKVAGEMNPVVLSAQRLSSGATEDLRDLGVTAFVRPYAAAEDLQVVFDAALTADDLSASDLSTTDLVAPRVTRVGRTDEDRRRLRALASLGIAELSAPSLRTLASIATEMAEMAGMTGAAVSLLLRHRQRLVATFGAAGDANRTEAAAWRFAADVVTEHGPLILSNALRHPGYRSNEQVMSGEVGAFLGLPIRTRRGLAVGTVSVFDPAPRPVHVHVVDRLMVLARRAAAELENPNAASRGVSEAPTNPRLSLLRRTLDGLDDGTLVFDSDGVCLLATQAIETLFGVSPAALLESSFKEVIETLARSCSDADQFRGLVALEHDGPYVLEEKLNIERPVRRIVLWRSRPLTVSARPHQLVTISDVTEYEDALRERSRLARTDHLTRVGNRRAAEDALKKEHARAGRGAKASLVMFDLDRFKSINDRFGHETGDRVLQSVARTLRASTRGSDIVFRWGGEEFLAILPDVDEAGARAFAERIRARVESLTIHGLDHPVTISAGIARLDSTVPPETSVARADENLYRAKASGRNRVA